MSVDMERLLDAVRHVESGGNDNAVSPAGAKGPYQFMDATAEEYGVKDPFNEPQAREGARRYLTKLMDQFGDVEHALVAYNGGPGRLKERGSISEMPLESRQYLTKVMSKYGDLVITGSTNQMDSQAEPMAPIELFPGESGARRKAANALFSDNHEDDVLRASVLDPRPVDQASRIYNMQLRTGLPVGLIERNLDEIEQRAKEDDFDPEEFRRQSPLLAQWLSTNPTQAALAQGDYENLSALEQTWATIKAVPAGFGEGISQERLMTLSYKAATGEITPQEEMERTKLKEEIKQTSQQFDQGAPSWFKAAASIVGLQIPMLGKGIKHGVQFGIPGGAALGATAGLVGGPGALATVPTGAVAGATGGFGVGFHASYIDQTYKLSVGEAFEDLEEAKDANGNRIDPTAAKYAAFLVAVPNSIMEFASLRTSVKAIPGVDKLIGKLTTKELKQVLVRPTVMAAMADFGKKYAAAVGTETFTEGMQKFLTIVSREIATGDMGEGFGEQDVQAIVGETTQAFKGSVVLGALASGPKVIEIYADMEKAAQNEQFMRQLGDIATNSKTFANSPEAFGDYVKQLSENGPVKNVFIPIESWNALFQDKAPIAAGEVFGDTKQYQEALTTGGDISISIETYAEKLAGTEFHDQLVPHIRFNPGEMTPTEALDAQNAEPIILAGLQKEMADKVAQEAPLAAVYQDVFTKLRDTGMGQQEADRNATIWRERLRSRAERLGIDPLQLYNEMPLTVQREFPSTGEVFAQKERGASVPTQNLIALFKGADPSTFLHETGHVWLEELRTDAMRPDAPAQLKQDWEAVKAWSGAKDDAIPTESHESFARAFEAYIREGKAPSFQLRKVFAQLKEWLNRIYKSASMLGVELTPEISEVMDRLIATDEAIKQAHERNEYNVPLFDQGMMTADEYAAYRQLMEEAKQTAEDNFRAKVMKELKREKLQSWRDEKKALEPKVRAEILEIPVYRAAYWIYSGKLPDGTEIEGLTTSKLDKQALLDMGVTLTDLPFRYQENGLHPDVVAELFGFSSGESLVRELVGLPTLKQAIDAEVSRRIREEHGGIIVQGTTLEEAAMEVQNTRQVDVFNMELRILKRMGAKREATHSAILKDIASQIISRKKIGELNPRLFEEAALRASQEAQEAMLGKDFSSGTGRNLDKAFDAKQKEMLNVFLFREATERKQEADKAVRKWKKFLFRSDERLVKTHDMNMVNAARAIASVHGVGGSADTAASYMRTLSQYDPDSYNDLREMVELASSDGRPIEDLTVADFSIVNDAIEGLWAMARRSRQVEIEGQKLERAQVVGELNTRITELVPPGKKRAGYDRAVSNWDKTKMGFLGGMAMLRRVEHWVDAMDDGDPNGVFRKYIWQPVSEAADRYRDARRVNLEKYQEIVKSIPKETFNVGKIEAPEIGYQFANKTELLGAMLHTGNDSNLQKLLRGREWGALTPEGELDSRKWDSFISRMHTEGVLTEADYKFIQSVWDLLDELKPSAQKAHKDMFGYFFDEVTARPITTPFGTFAGGYYPAIVDTFIVEDAAIRAEKETLEGRPSSFMFPTTGRGFTKKRTEMYAKPLSLDLALIPTHVGKVLRFIHLEPVIKDIGRVAIDKNFRNHLASLDTEIGTVMLMPWLQRSALQMVEQPGGPRMRQFDKFFHAIRTNTGLQMMAVNISVALQQISGVSLAAIKVKPRYLAGAVWRYISSPMDYTSHVNESSTFMRNRLSAQTIEIKQSIDNILLNPSAYDKAKAFANKHGYFMQTGMQNAVDMITWGGAYEQATRNGADEKTAIRQADSAVRETQGTFHAEDISRFEAGPAYMRVFTMFYSYFNMAANLNATEFVKSMRLNGFASGGRAAYIYAMGFMIPAVIGEAIVQAMSGQLFDDDDDDGYLDNVLAVFFGGQARMGTAMVPFVGSTVQAGINQFNDKWYDDRISVSPVISTFEATASVPYDIFKLATEEDPSIKKAVRDILTLTGIATGLPLAPLARPIGYLSDIEQGKIEDPDNPVEFTRGLISGKAPR